MMKYLLALCLALVAALPAWACDVCENQQPKVLKGISHGTGPQSAWDMPIIAISSVIVLVTLIFSVKFLVWPKEVAKDHIKRTILQNSLSDDGH